MINKWNKKAVSKWYKAWWSDLFPISKSLEKSCATLSMVLSSDEIAEREKSEAVDIPWSPDIIKMVSLKKFIETDMFETPPDVFKELDDEFHFDVDLCASENNHLCYPYVDDIEWHMKLQPSIYKTYYMNPPYSRGKLSHCIGHAKELAHVHGKTVVCLLPSKTDTKAFHKHIWCKHTNKPYDGVEVRFLERRIKFLRDGKPQLDKKGKPQSGKFGSMIVIFRGKRV